VKKADSTVECRPNALQIALPLDNFLLSIGATRTLRSDSPANRLRHTEHGFGDSLKALPVAEPVINHSLCSCPSASPLLRGALTSHPLPMSKILFNFNLVHLPKKPLQLPPDHDTSRLATSTTSRRRTPTAPRTNCRVRRDRKHANTKFV
jgi:hypothetical protein